MRRLLWSVLALAAAACGTRGTLFNEVLRPLPLVATQRAVVQVVPQTNRAVVITPGEATPRALLLTKGARAVSVVPNSDALVVLGGTAKAPRLDLVDVGANEVRSVETPGYFDAVTWSADGRFGVLSYLATAGTGQLVARNLNEVGLLSLPALTVQRLQLDTESLAPRAVLFGPQEANRQLVAVVLERGVSVFDALHPEVAPRRISIRPQGSAVEVSVADALFSRDAHWLFLRASGIDDVVVVELGAEVGAPLSASINFVAGGQGLADIAVPPPGFDDAVLAVFGASREAYLLDARGIVDRGRRLGLDAAMDRLALLSGHRVLLWTTGGRAAAAWDVGDGRSGSVQLDGASVGPVVLPALDKAVFPMAAVAGGGGPALSSLTVVEDVNRLRFRVQGVQLAKPFGASALDSGAQRLFFTVAQSSAVVTMDLPSLALAEVTLDGAAKALLYVPQGDWLVADHGGAYGELTVLPAGTTERAGALHYADYALTGDLDRAEEPR